MTDLLKDHPMPPYPSRGAARGPTPNVDAHKRARAYLVRRVSIKEPLGVKVRRHGKLRTVSDPHAWRGDTRSVAPEHSLAEPHVHAVSTDRAVACSASGGSGRWTTSSVSAHREHSQSCAVYQARTRGARKGTGRSARCEFGGIPVGARARYSHVNVFATTSPKAQGSASPERR